MRWRRVAGVVTGLLLLSFFLNAFPHVNTIKDTAFYLAVIGVLILAVKKKIRIDLRSPLLPPLVLLALWASVTTAAALEIGDSLHSLLSHLVKYLLMLVATVSVLSTPRHIVWLMRTFVVSTLLFCLGAVIDFYVIQAHPWSTRLGFEAAAHNIICFGANLAVIFALRELRPTGRRTIQPLILVAVAVFIATTLLTQSRGGILALSASVIGLFLWEKKFKVVVTLAAALGVGLAMLPVKERFLDRQSLSNIHRLGTFYYYVEVFKDHPVTGIGFAIDIFDNAQVYGNETYFQRMPEAFRQRIPDGFREELFTVLPHCMLLSVLVRMGLIGLGIYLYLLAAFFFMGWKTANSEASRSGQALSRWVVAAMVMFLMGGLFEPVFIHQLDTIFFALLAMAIVLWHSSPAGARSPQVPAESM